MTYCGFNYAGTCAAAFVGGPRACENYNPDTGLYGDCHADSSAKKYKTPKYREVITTYVTPMMLRFSGVSITRRILESAQSGSVEADLARHRR